MNTDISSGLNLSKVKSEISRYYEPPKQVTLRENEGKANLNNQFYPSKFSVNGSTYELIHSEIYDDNSWALYKKKELSIVIEV